MSMKLFTAHPATQGESYVAHARVALKIGSMCLSAGAMALTHAVFPFLFETGASSKIQEINTFLRAHGRSAEH